MKGQAFNATLLFYPNKNPKLRLFALWYFTILMIVWNVVGHTVLGFEQSWATPVVAVLTAVGTSMALDWIDSWAQNREVRFTGSVSKFLNFLPACFIPGFACGMLLQVIVRAKLFGTPFFVPLMPMTSAAFIIFTLYMIPDPATTPFHPARQALFGFAVAMVYGVIQLMHLVFGLFFALLIVCAVRGLGLHLLAFTQRLRLAGLLPSFSGPAQSAGRP
jgi:hypothetical protein